MVQEDRKILNTIWCHKHKWMGHVIWHDGLLRDVLEGRMLGKRTRVRRMQLINDLLEQKNYTDLKKTAEDGSVWRTRRRDCHKPAPQADNSMIELGGLCTISLKFFVDV